MKVAIIGSRNINQNDYEKLLPHIPIGASQIISGGATGADELAVRYAEENNLKLVTFTPEYEKFGKSATLKRNIQIIEYSDYVIALWDGHSRGTAHVIVNCIEIRVPVKVVLIKGEE